MKLTCIKEELALGLDKVEPAVSKKTVLPILLNILLQVSTEGLRLVATDMEIAIAFTVKAEIEEMGSLTVPATAFCEFVRSLASGAVIKIESTDNKVVVRSGRSRCTLAFLPAEEFPLPPVFDETNCFSLAARPFMSVLQRTEFSASTDETRYTLNGVQLTILEKMLKGVALDGRRMAIASQALDLDAPAMAAIVPNRAVTEVLHVMNDSTADHRIQVAIVANSISFKRDHLLLQSRLIDGNFPNYQQNIPTSHSIVLDVLRAELVTLVQRVSIGADKLTMITLLLEPNTLRLKSNQQGRVEMEDELPVDYLGEAFSIAFKGSSFLDALKAIGTEKVSLCFGVPKAPFMVKPVNDDSAFYVLSPLVLN